MDTKESHLAYLRKMGNFKIDCCTDNLKSEEISIIEKYGNWFLALINEKLMPITMAQEDFIRVSKGELPPSSIYEISWSKYQRTKESENKPGDPQNKEFLPYQDTFYSREMVEKQKKMMYGVISSRK